MFREELIGNSVFLLHADLSPEWLGRNVRPRLEAGEIVTGETHRRRKDGTVFAVEIRARNFRLGERLVNLSQTLDIAERKRAEEGSERLRQPEVELTHIDRGTTMEELSGPVAHKINQPLTRIVSNGRACQRWSSGIEAMSTRDCGTGLGRNTIEKLFEPCSAMKPGGMATGFSISRSILRGGWLWATVNDGPGRAIHFALMSYLEEGSHAGIAAV